MYPRNPAFLGQIRLVPPGYQPPPPPSSAFEGGVCPPGKTPLIFAGRTVCVDSGFYPVGAAGAEPGAVRPPGTPEIRPPIEYPPPPIEDLGPKPVPVPSQDDFYPYRTDMAPLLGTEAAQGLPCPPGQYRPPGAGWCIPVATAYRWIPTIP